MSHSQFHRLLLKLRHAWLNLWDKHMTTGRINQVTISERKVSHPGLNPTRSVRTWKSSQDNLSIQTSLQVCYIFLCSRPYFREIKIAQLVHRYKPGSAVPTWCPCVEQLASLSLLSTILVLLTLHSFSAAPSPADQSIVWRLQSAVSVSHQ